MMRKASDGGGSENRDDHATFSALLEDSAEDLYERAPCGYLSTLLDGTIAKINTTLLNWLGHQRGDLVGRKTFSDLLTVGGGSTTRRTSLRCCACRERSAESLWNSRRPTAAVCRYW